MLIQFSVRNYRSFKEESLLSFSATKYTEHAGHVIEAGKEKLLPAAAVFGANGSGKSAFIEALQHMRKCVLQDGIKGIGSVPVFAFDADPESVFEVYFLDEKTGKSYCYGFIVNSGEVAEEWLQVKARTARTYRDLFHRTAERIDADGISETCEVTKNTLYLSLLSQKDCAKVKPVMSFFENMIFLSGEYPQQNEITEYDDGLVRYLSSFDASIREVKKEGGVLYLVHEAAGKTMTLALSEESEGTRRMTALYPVLKKTIETGGLLAIDNPDYGLHTLLVRNIIITFLSATGNPNHAQLVFTTHDSWLLSNHVFRRDEVWFASKDPEGKSSLYSLAEFQDEDGNKIRKDENHEKNYMLGKYGAVPQLDYLHFSED